MLWRFVPLKSCVIYFVAFQVEAREHQDAILAERFYNSRLVKDFEIDYLTEYIYNFTIPKNDPTFACIKLDASFSFTATYPYLSNVS